MADGSRGVAFLRGRNCPRAPERRREVSPARPGQRLKLSRSKGAERARGRRASPKGSGKVAAQKANAWDCGGGRARLLPQLPALRAGPRAASCPRRAPAGLSSPARNARGRPAARPGAPRGPRGCAALPPGSGASRGQRDGRRDGRASRPQLLNTADFFQEFELREFVTVLSFPLQAPVCEMTAKTHYRPGVPTLRSTHVSWAAARWGARPRKMGMKWCLDCSWN